MRRFTRFRFEKDDYYVMNPRRWGVSNPFNTEMIQGLDREIQHDHSNDALLDAANRAQRRKFQRTEWLKTIGALIGGLLLVVLALIIVGVFVH